MCPSTGRRRLTARSTLAWPRTAVQSSTLFRARYTVLATICASHSIHQPAIGGAKAYQLSVSGPECVCVHAIITFSGRMAEDLWSRMDAIDRFAADVAHEIKNPLTSLRSAVETADRKSTRLNSSH